MDTLLYLVLAALVYGFIASQSARAVEREMRTRRPPPALHLRLVDDFDVRPGLPPEAPRAKRLTPSRRRPRNR